MKNKNLPKSQSRNLFSAILLVFSATLTSQTNWNTELNDIPDPFASGKLGTLNGKSLEFHTDNTKRITLTPDGELVLENMAGTGDRFVTVSPNGTFKYIGWTASGCSNQTSPWLLGGINVNSSTLNRIGTCDNYDFILKANNKDQIFIKAGSASNGSGLIGIGPGNSNPSSQLDISDGTGAPYQAHTRIYGDFDGTIESNYGLKMLYTGPFIIAEGNTTSNTNRLNFDFSGVMNVPYKSVFGTNASGTGVGSRVQVFALNSGDNGITISGGGTSGHAFGTFNSAGAPKFLIYKDGKTHVADNMQIGFSQSTTMMDPDARLNIETYGPTANGIKITTNYDGCKVLEVANSANTANSNATFLVYSSGKTHIGSGRPAASPAVASNALLSVNGMILAKDIRVANANTHWADFVFESKYKLMPLTEVANYVREFKHLPEIPSAAQVKEDGIDLAEMNVKLLQKVEELYLHAIELEKKLEEQNSRLKSLEKH